MHIFINDSVVTAFYQAPRFFLTTATYSQWSSFPRSSILTIFWELSLVPYWKPILVQSWLLDVSTCIVYLSFYCNKISYKSNLREKGFTLAHSFRWDILEEKTWQPEQEAASYIVSGSRESWMLVLSSLSLFYAVQDLRPGCLLLGFVFSPQLT